MNKVKMNNWKCFVKTLNVSFGLQIRVFESAIPISNSRQENGDRLCLKTFISEKKLPILTTKEYPKGLYMHGAPELMGIFRFMSQ